MDQGELSLLIYSHSPPKVSPLQPKCEAIKNIFQVYGKGLSLSEVQGIVMENFSIGAVHRENSTFSVFSGDLQGVDSLMRSVPRPPLPSPLPAFLGGKKLGMGLCVGCVGLCLGPARPQPHAGEGKGTWGHFLVPAAAREGSSGHGEPGNSCSSGRNSPRRLNGVWKRGESSKASF